MTKRTLRTGPTQLSTDRLRAVTGGLAAPASTPIVIKGGDGDDDIKVRSGS